MRVIAKYARQVRRAVDEHPGFAGFFDPRALLVPVPGCGTADGGSNLVAHRLAEAFVREGLAAAHFDCLRRVRTVGKSAIGTRGARPGAESHYASLVVRTSRSHDGTATLILVDDVVTRGRTLLAAASRLQESFPHARIQAFALIRTLGFAPRLERLLDPCVGEIRWRGGDARRNP